MSRATTAADLAAYDAQTAIDAAAFAKKQAAKAEDAADPAKVAQRKQAEQNRRTKIELLSQEKSALARLNPRRNRWPELRKIDERIGNLELRRGTVSDELQALRDQFANALNADRSMLAGWTLAGAVGAKPQPSAPALEQRIAELEQEHDASALAAETLLAERVEFVDRHRSRLVKDAEQATATARAEYERLIDELEAARRELVDATATTTWAKLFPHSSLASTLPTSLLLVGRRLDRHVPGYGGQISVDNLRQLLLEDARLLVEAAPADQVGAHRGQSEQAVLGREAEWGGGGPKRQQTERQQAIERYRREWGVAPSEWA